MTARSLSAVLVITALIHAPLARADARMIEVSNCNGGTSLLVLPENDDGSPKKGNDCAKACHTTCDRRTKAADRKSARPA